ncbi:MAG TPA: FHA domain-containing protein, partial [Ramlibacter sp.]
APATATAARPAAPAGATASADAHASASIKVLSGAAAGREVPLVKVVTTIGKPGVAVAAITKRSQGFVVAHVEGSNKPTLNGAAIGSEPVALKNGDMLELAGTQMQFLMAG